MAHGKVFDVLGVPIIIAFGEAAMTDYIGAESVDEAFWMLKSDIIALQEPAVIVYKMLKPYTPDEIFNKLLENIDDDFEMDFHKLAIVDDKLIWTNDELAPEDYGLECEELNYYHSKYSMYEAIEKLIGPDHFVKKFDEWLRNNGLTPETDELIKGEGIEIHDWPFGTAIADIILGADPLTILPEVKKLVGEQDNYVFKREDVYDPDEVKWVVNGWRIVVGPGGVQAID